MTTWTHHGETRATPLFAPGSINFLTGGERSGKSSIAADIAVAIAAGDVGCGLSAPDKSGARASMAGFFGHATGAPSGVMIVADSKHADSISDAINAAALARGVVGALPISWTASNRINSADGLRDMAGHVSRHRDDESLVIIDEIDFADPEMSLSVQAVQRSAKCAVLVITKEPLTSLIGADSLILETADGVLTLAKPASGEPWAREFSLDRINLGDAEAVAVRPGKVAAFAPRYQYVAPVAPAPKFEPEKPIVSKIVLAIGGGKITPEESARWPDYDDFVHSIGDAVLAVERNSDKGRTEILIVEPPRGWDVREEVQRLETELKTKGLLDAAIINVAKQRMLEVA